MNTLSPRWRAAGAAILLVLVGWACNCGTVQQLAGTGIETAAPTPTVVPTQPPPTAAPTEAPTQPPPTDAPTEAPTEAPPASFDGGGEVLFEDDFSNPGSGWYVASGEEGSYAYEDGAYVLIATTNGTQIWGEAGRSFGDAVITVEAEQVSAPDNNNNAYGVGCRVQPNGDGYFVRISGDGYYTITRYTTGAETDEGEFITLADWMTSDAINQGKTSNVIGVRCVGSTIELYANGVLLGSAEDTTYAAGDVALTATTFEDTSTTVHFDNLVVREP